MWIDLEINFLWRNNPKFHHFHTPTATSLVQVITISYLEFDNQLLRFLHASVYTTQNIFNTESKLSKRKSHSVLFCSKLNNLILFSIKAEIFTMATKPYMICSTPINSQILPLHSLSSSQVSFIAGSQTVQKFVCLRSFAPSPLRTHSAKFLTPLVLVQLLTF